MDSKMYKYLALSLAVFGNSTEVVSQTSAIPEDRPGPSRDDNRDYKEGMPPKSDVTENRRDRKMDSDRGNLDTSLDGLPPKRRVAEEPPIDSLRQESMERPMERKDLESTDLRDRLPSDERFGPQKEPNDFQDQGKEDMRDPKLMDDFRDDMISPPEERDFNDMNPMDSDRLDRERGSDYPDYGNGRDDFQRDPINDDEISALLGEPSQDDPRAEQDMSIDYGNMSDFPNLSDRSLSDPAQEPPSASFREMSPDPLPLSEDRRVPQAETTRDTDQEQARKTTDNNRSSLADQKDEFEGPKKDEFEGPKKDEIGKLKSDEF